MPKPTRRTRRRLRIIFFGLLALVALPPGFFIGMSLLMLMWIARPPEEPRDVALLSEVPVRRGSRTVLGRCWFDGSGPLKVLYLTGTPFEMGYANGVLTRDLMHRQEDHLLGMVRERIPNRVARFMITFYVTWHNRNLPEYVSPEHQSEILGVCRGCPDRHPDVGPYYHRVLNYHAAHDISHMLIGSPWVVPGCTSFGAAAGGRMLTGRNFDWEAGDVFDRDRVLILCEPDRGIPFVSLAWSGMVGCVSGMNRKGVSVTINGIRGRPPEGTGTPVSLVVRDVLQYASNLEEAVAIIRKARLFVSELFLVGSRADGKFVVIEKTPETTAVRESEEGVSICANHFLSDALKGDPDNVAFMAEGVSVSRHERMRELLEASRGRLTADRVAEILRDRNLPGGRFPGNGHRGTLNALIATHAVIMDPAEGLFWAAAPPHQLGRFFAVDVNTFERRPKRDVAADPFLASGGFGRYREWLKLLGEASRGDPEDALKILRTAEALNPGFYMNAWMQGRALLAAGRSAEAADAFKAALAAEPASSGELSEIDAALKGEGE